MKRIVMILIILCLVIPPILTQATPVFAKVKMDFPKYDRTVIVDPWWLWQPFFVVDGQFFPYP